ncbi:acyltransferase [Ascodesmis nigricans]|uniref:Acyltransferase n=1 Tax=Ascodesmis nigricans TaxID=341454 RepID=A0A4S2MPF1_9PEZI|nr:acyltransferase [Ascodesmis nigricans]
MTNTPPPPPTTDDTDASNPDLDLSSSTPQLHPALVPPQLQHNEESRDLITREFSHFRHDPLSFLRNVSLHYSGTGWRAYENPIGQPIFYKGFTENMKERILGTEALGRKIDELAERRVRREREMGVLRGQGEGETVERRREELRRQMWEVADGIVDGMICKFESKRFIRGAYYLCMQLLSRTYHQGIHVSSSEVANLQRVARMAAEKKQSLIFLPCHRSHVDYVSLQVICYRLGIVLPFVVAGDNLNFPLVGQFLQNAGAFYIRRTFGGDELYQSAVQSYVDAILQGGFNFECFIEGGRSRTGKLLPPKFGILGFVMDALLSGRVEDAWVIPVSTQYDKVIETEAYVNELLGIPKQKENLWDFLSSSKYLSLKMGRVDVRFHDAWSLRGFINDFKARTQPDAPQTMDVQNPEIRVKMLRSLGYKVLNDINAVSVVMPTSLIGTVLLTLRGRGVGLSELVRRIDWLSTRIRAKGGRVAHFGGLSTEEVVYRGLEVLGGLVGRVDGLAEETFYAIDRFQLSFYRNMVIHLFVAETIISAAMYTRIKAGGAPQSQRIPYDALVDQVAFLSKLFRKEFIYSASGLLPNLHRTLDELEAEHVIAVARSSGSGEIDFVELTQQERSCGRENFDFYCFLLWPFIEGTWLAAVSCFLLAPPCSAPVSMKLFEATAQLAGKTLYHQGDLSYFEAVNKETLKNSFQRFREEGILVVENGNVALAEEWKPRRDGRGKIVPEGRLWEFAEKIAVSRREGKNRRDSASVGTRVMGMVEMLGEELRAESEREAAPKARM